MIAMPLSCTQQNKVGGRSKCTITLSQTGEFPTPFLKLAEGYRPCVGVPGQEVAKYKSLVIKQQFISLTQLQDENPAF